MDPQTGEKRLERNLFSQDAGEPLVYKGLLYWPLEDALLANGKGEVSATDGENWGSYNIDSALMYHTSELHLWQGDLLAITGARHAGMQLSRDNGKSWEELYNHPAPDRRIARIKDLVMLNGVAYAALRDKKIQRPARWTGQQFETAKTWNLPVRSLTAFNGSLYMIVGRAKERQIWKYDGKEATRVSHANHYIDLSVQDGKLWTVTKSAALLSMQNDGEWQEHMKLENGTPYEIKNISGALYVAGTGDDKRGIIWGPPKHEIANNFSNKNNIAIKAQYPINQETLNWLALGNKIDSLLSNKATYKNRRNEELLALLKRAIINGAPDGFCAERMRAPIPDIKVATFGGNVNTTAQDIVHIRLLKCMEQTGQQDVPIEFLTERWSAKSNSYEKYLFIPLTALKTIATTGQKDAATIDALIARLDYQDDPDWLQSQTIGTLTSITGQHYGYDLIAWKNWHKKQ